MILCLQESLDTWPCVNVMIKTSKNMDNCEACSKTPSVKLLQLYGQPYSQQTLRYSEPIASESEVKVSHSQVTVFINSCGENLVSDRLSYSNFEMSAKTIRPHRF